MHAPSPLSCPQRCARADQGAGLSDLRESIHRATAGRVGRDEQAARQRFADGVLVSETSLSCWGALVWPSAAAR